MHTWRKATFVSEILMQVKKSSGRHSQEGKGSKSCVRGFTEIREKAQQRIAQDERSHTGWRQQSEFLQNARVCSPEARLKENQNWEVK